MRLGVLLLALCAASPARAAERPRLVLFTVGLDPKAQAEAGRIDYFAEQAVVRSGRFELVRLAEKLDAPGARARAEKAAEADALLAQGQKAYEALDTQRAAQLFNDAAKAFRQTDLTRRFIDLMRASVMRAASLVANGETRAAVNEIEKITALDPRTQFSPNYFPPDILKQVEDARRLALAGKGKLQVTSNVPGAQVYLNGQFRGVTPATLSGLTGAEHWLTLIAPGYRWEQRPAQLGSTEVRLEPAPGFAHVQRAAAAIAQDSEGPGRDEAARALGRAAGADQVLLVVAQTAPHGAWQLSTFRIEVKDGHNWAYERVETPPGALATALDVAFAGLLSRDEPKANGPVTHHLRAGSKLSRRTAGYALLGVGAALLGGAVVFGLQANAQRASLETIPQIDQARSDRARQTGKSYAVTADILGVAGLVAGGAGGFLAFFPPPGEGAR